MAKDIKEITESEIDKIFELTGIKRKEGNTNYQIIEKENNHVKLNDGYGEEMILNSSGVFLISPSNERTVCPNSFAVAQYLIRREYEFKED